jgi:N-acetylglucosamine-6-sulfatase
VFEEHHYGDYLRAAGYYTGYFGKYLNPPAMEPYCHNLGSPIPGWDEMLGMCVTAYYNIPWVNSSGHIERTGTAPNEYSTSIIGNRTVDFITRAAAMKRPFFVSAATRAPHGPSTPAPWYMDKFKDTKNLVTPAFNFTGTGHVDWIQDQKPVSAKESAAFDHQFADRWRTLLSVDDLVEAVVEVLAKTNLLDKTFIFYSSDHGYHLGHLRLGAGKSHFYEFDSRVPMLIRGPGVAVGSAPSFIAGNTDLGPSFLDLAGVPTPAKMDGRSIIPMLIPNATAAETRPWRTFFPVEFSGLSGWGSGGRLNDCPNNTYRSLRFLDPESGLNTHFSEYTTVSDYNYDAPNWREWYNLTDDRYQLNNGWATQDSAKQTELLKLLQTTWHCQGVSCP